jgi:hypothetical protein
MASHCILYNQKQFSDLKVVIYREDTDTVFEEIYTNKVVLASASPVFHAMFSHYFHESISGEHKIVTTSEADAKAHLKVIISMHTRAVEHSTFEEFLHILAIYHKYMMKDLFELCIINNTISPFDELVAHRLLDMEKTYDTLAWKELLSFASKELIQKYGNNREFFLTPGFLHLTADQLKRVIALDCVKDLFKYANSLYQAIKVWCNESKHSPWNKKLKEMDTTEDGENTNDEQLAIDLLELINYDLCSAHFVADVVDKDDFLVNVSDKVKCIKKNLVNSSLAFHAYSKARKKFEMKDNPAYNKMLTKIIKAIEFRWIIPDIKDIIPNHHYFSDSHHFEGYWFRLMARVAEVDGSFRFDVYLSLDTQKTGIDEKYKFFVQTVSKLWTLDKHRGEFLRIREQLTDIFAQSYLESGFSNFLGVPWEHLYASTSPYVDNGQVVLAVDITHIT